MADDWWRYRQKKGVRLGSQGAQHQALAVAVGRVMSRGVAVLMEVDRDAPSQKPGALGTLWEMRTTLAAKG